MADTPTLPSYVIRLRDGSKLNPSIQELSSHLGANFAFTRPDRTAVQSIRDVRSTAAAAVTLLGILAAAALIHRLAVATRSQRRQLAVLRAMGFAGGQVLCAGATQGFVVVVLASLGAVPLGIVAGRLGWRTIADYLGVVPKPVMPMPTLQALLAVVLLLGVGTGLGLAERARRSRPGKLLQSE